MVAKARKSVVQNIIRNLLEMEIPEIQTASKELSEWIKQLEQHSFKLQHYATEIDNWATEEDEIDTVELTDLIKDLESTLSDMRKSTAAPAIEAPELVENEGIGSKMLREYGRTGRILQPKTLPKSEFKPSEARPVVRIRDLGKKPELDSAETSQAAIAEGELKKTGAKAELPTAGKEVSARGPGKAPPEKEETRGGYMTPEGFIIRKTRL
jgi:hypothetical protein